MIFLNSKHFLADKLVKRVLLTRVTLDWFLYRVKFQPGFNIYALWYNKDIHLLLCLIKETIDTIRYIGKIMVLKSKHHSLISGLILKRKINIWWKTKLNQGLIKDYKNIFTWVEKYFLILSIFFFMFISIGNKLFYKHYKILAC